MLKRASLISFTLLMGISAFAAGDPVPSASTPPVETAAPAPIAQDPCPAATEDALVLFEKSLTPTAFGRKQQAILKNTEFWERFLGRRMSQTEFNRSKLTEQVLRMAKFDRPYLLLKFASPKAFPIQLGYEIWSQDITLLASLKGELAMVTEANLRQSQLIDAISKVEARITQVVKDVTAGLDEYEGMLSMLKRLSTGDNQAAANAKVVLDKLQSKYILTDYMTSAGLSDVVTPDLVALHKMVDQYPEIKLWNLRKIRNREARTAFLAVVPTQSLTDAILRRAARIPWLNQGKFRAFVESLLSERNRVLYYPDIQRIVNGTGTPEEKLQMVEQLNAGTNDELLITLKRRIDLSQLWDDLKTAADARTNKTIATKMEAVVQTASGLDDLSLDGKTGLYTIVTRGTDLAIFAAANYYTWAHNLHLFGAQVEAKGSRRPASVTFNALANEQLPDPVPVGMEKLNPTPFTDFEEHELDQLYDALTLSAAP